MTRGLVYAEPGAAPALEEIVLDEPGPNEVRVRVRACGVCHTDLHVLESAGWHMRFPILLGHEAAGIVEAVGEGVAHVAPGDAVVVAWHVPCGECRNCLRGDARRCADYLRGARKMRRAADGSPLAPVLRTGGYADELVVHAACAVRVPAELPFEQACLLACGFSTGAGAALWTTPVREGSSVAVIGCGGVGLAVVQGARLAGAERIVAVDTVPEKLALALELGATEAVEAGGEVREIDYAFSAIGAPAGLVAAVRMLAYGGTACLVGVPPSRATLDLDVELDLFARHATIAVSHGGDVVPHEDLPFLAQAALDGKLDLARFVTATCSLEDVPAALEALHAPTGVRTVALV
ncbi:MAG TPA: alcohol dehydrogenase catalytic domain-containing protein [Gaiellaceae bacterium]|nr:alcohol dehydrogenase catalytic domain-containing protein [Gaiellaceae bacterium]